MKIHTNQIKKALLFTIKIRNNYTTKIKKEITKKINKNINDLN